MNLKQLLFFNAVGGGEPGTVNLLNVLGSRAKISGIYADALSNGVINDSSIGSGNGDFLLWSEQYPAGTYTFSCAWEGSGMNGVRFLCTKAFTGNSGYVSLYTAYYKDIPSNEITITLDEPFGIGLVILSRSGHNGEPGKIYDLQFEQGDHATPYVPYKG